MKGNDQDPAQRPDVVVQLPNGRCIVIDAKTPLDAYLSAMSAVDEIQRAFYLKTHAAQVRSHLSQLGGKQYWQRFDNSPDFVVCFLPSEVLFSAALEQDPSLIEVGSQLNVILATPTTLIALLKAVAYGWQQMEITRNAIEICKAGEDLYRKLAGTQEHFTRLGNALSGSVRHFNNLVGAVEGRGSVFSLAAKLHALKIGQGEIAEVAPVESAARVLQSEHWDDPVALAAAEETSEDRR
jgi:DNA recombination protein RmuC